MTTTTTTIHGAIDDAIHIQPSIVVVFRYRQCQRLFVDIEQQKQTLRILPVFPVVLQKDRHPDLPESEPNALANFHQNGFFIQNQSNKHRKQELIKWDKKCFILQIKKIIFEVQ